MKNLLLILFCVLSFNFYAQPDKEYYEAGISDFRAKNYLAAASNFTKYIELKPNTWQVYLCRGICETHLGNHKAALADYEKVIELDPKNSTAKKMVSLTKSYVEGGKLFSLDYNSFPSDALAYAQSGETKEKAGDYEGAIKDYSLAIDLNPLAGYYFARANAQYSLKLFVGAIEDFTEAIKLNKKYAHAYLNRGSAQYSAGNKTEACADWQHALKLGITQASDVLGKYCN